MAMPKNIPKYVLAAFFGTVLSCIKFKDEMSKKSRKVALNVLQQVTLLDIHAFGFFSFTEQTAWNASRRDYDRCNKIDLSVYISEGVKLDFDLYVTQEQLNEIFKTFYSLLGEMLVTGAGGIPVKLSSELSYQEGFNRFLVTNEFIEYRLPRQHIRKEIETAKVYFNRDAEKKRQQQEVSQPDALPTLTNVTRMAFSVLGDRLATWRLCDGESYVQIKETLMKYIHQQQPNSNLEDIEKEVEVQLQALIPRVGYAIQHAALPVFEANL